jgi:hypothetical protein
MSSSGQHPARPPAAGGPDGSAARPGLAAAEAAGELRGAYRPLAPDTGARDLHPAGERGCDGHGAEPSVPGEQAASRAVPAAGGGHRARVADGVPQRSRAPALALQLPTRRPPTAFAGPPRRPKGRLGMPSRSPPSSPRGQATLGRRQGGARRLHGQRESPRQPQSAAGFRSRQRASPFTEKVHVPHGLHACPERWR